MTVVDLFGALPEVRKISGGFDAFWAQYPRKCAKRTAETAYSKALQRGASESDILAGAMRYAAHTQDKEERFIAHPATWLNGDRWLDQPSRQSGPRSFMDVVRGT